jgi:putative hydrolase of the HAD superfamily
MTALLALDVDGVLLDPMRGGRGPWQVAFGERFGVDARQLDGALFAARWSEVIVGRRTVEAALSDALEELGWDMGVDAALACWFEEDFVIAPVVLEAATVWAGRGMPVVLVSNQEPRRARYLEEHLAPLLPIGGTAFSGDLGLTKSEQLFYERAEKQLGIAEPGPSVVFLDDTLDNVEVARRHGWTSIHFTVGGDWRNEVDGALEEAVAARPSR